MTLCSMLAAFAVMLVSLSVGMHRMPPSARSQQATCEKAWSRCTPMAKTEVPPLLFWVDALPAQQTAQQIERQRSGPIKESRPEVAFTDHASDDGMAGSESDTGISSASRRHLPLLSQDTCTSTSSEEAEAESTELDAAAVERSNCMELMKYNLEYLRDHLPDDSPMRAQVREWERTFAETAESPFDGTPAELDTLKQAVILVSGICMHHSSKNNFKSSHSRTSIMQHGAGSPFSNLEAKLPCSLADDVVPCGVESATELPTEEEDAFRTIQSSCHAMQPADDPLPTVAPETRSIPVESESDAGGSRSKEDIVDLASLSRDATSAWTRYGAHLAQRTTGDVLAFAREMSLRKGSLFQAFSDHILHMVYKRTTNQAADRRGAYTIPRGFYTAFAPDAEHVQFFCSANHLEPLQPATTLAKQIRKQICLRHALYEADILIRTTSWRTLNLLNSFRRIVRRMQQQQQQQQQQQTEASAAEEANEPSRRHALHAEQQRWDAMAPAHRHQLLQSAERLHGCVTRNSTLTYHCMAKALSTMPLSLFVLLQQYGFRSMVALAQTVPETVLATTTTTTMTTTRGDSGQPGNFQLPIETYEEQRRLFMSIHGYLQSALVSPSTEAVLYAPETEINPAIYDWPQNARAKALKKLEEYHALSDLLKPDLESVDPIMATHRATFLTISKCALETFTHLAKDQANPFDHYAIPADEKRDLHQALRLVESAEDIVRLLTLADTVIDELIVLNERRVRRSVAVGDLDIGL